MFKKVQHGAVFLSWQHAPSWGQSMSWWACQLRLKSQQSTIHHLAVQLLGAEHVLVGLSDACDLLPSQPVTCSPPLTPLIPPCSPLPRPWGRSTCWLACLATPWSTRSSA